MSYANINRVVLTGRLTREPEMRSLASGASVCGLRIACNGVRKTDDGYVERPNYFDVSVFGAAADAVGTYTRTGSRVAVDGRLEWREWETAEAERRQAVSIVADTVQFLDTKADAERGDGFDAGGDGDLAGVGVDEVEI
jgi:single-strand DNA-binding protein